MSGQYQGNIDFTELCLVLSDAAPYAIKAVSTLKKIFPSLKRVTCLNQMAHSLCENLRCIAPNSNSIPSINKRLLIIHDENQMISNETFGLRILEFPILTRWGSWLDLSLIY